MEKLFRKEEEVDEDDFPIRSQPTPGRAVPTSHLVRPTSGLWVLRVADARAVRGLVDSMRRDRNGVAAGADSALARAASSSGAPLPASLRARFEQSLGADLSGVRVHTGADSAAAADAVGAQAYTTGQDIHFADGRFSPDDPFGMHLLAHEVAHTVQQAGGGPAHQNKLEVSTPGDSLEVEADRAADAMLAGAPAHVSGGPTIAARSPGEQQSTAAANSSGQGPAAAQSPTGDPGSPANEPNTSPSGSAGDKSTPESTQKVKVTVNVTTTAGPPITFDAKDYATLYQQASARADGGQEAGSCACGTLDQDYKTSDDNVTDATYTVPITISLPQWNQLGQQSPEDQAKFKAWLASVTTHEQQHAKIFADGYAKLKTQVIGPKQTDCNTQFTTVDDQVQAAQKAFDASNQPAPLAAPGGTTKIGPNGSPQPAPGAPNP